MDIFSVLTMIGGLALFLYGMQVMGDGLKKASGGKLEMILEKLTSNKLMAVLLGAGVTAVIQSSSATTVMVVGFVNSGIMKLSQAVGVAREVFRIQEDDDEKAAVTGIEATKEFYRNLGLPVSFEEAELKTDQIDYMARHAVALGNGSIGNLKQLGEEDAKKIYHLCIR